MFWAGTFFTTGKLATKCKRKCLLEKASGLAPFTATRLDPMLSRRQLLGRIQQTPHWEQIKRNFTWAPHGLTIWAPILGNPNVRSPFSASNTTFLECWIFSKVTNEVEHSVTNVSSGLVLSFIGWPIILRLMCCRPDSFMCRLTHP